MVSLMPDMLPSNLDTKRWLSNNFCGCMREVLGTNAHATTGSRFVLADP